MRHGQAEGMASSDAERALTPFGEQEAAAAAKHLQQEASTSDNFSDSLLVVASPYRRAQQTARITCDALQVKHSMVTSSAVTPDRNPLDAVSALGKIWTEALEEGRGMRNILVVAHLPMVSRLINRLVWGEEGQRVPMGTAYLAKLELDLSAGVVQGLAEMDWVKPPL